MHFSSVPLSSISLASALLSGFVQATYLSNELSFGHNGRISPDSITVPNFHLVGKPDSPDILSNKLVLTQPGSGNQRGAVWAENSLGHSAWAVDVDFRATGPERGGGNFNIWYASSGRDVVGMSSIYTVGKFDGLALVIDQYASSGGYIRGFLNDGNIDYKSHHSVDSLAFGHCIYSYRNLGRPSRIAIRQSKDTFRVEVDGRLCFDSPKIKLPLGNYLGVTAASAETADSFEIFKFVTTTDNHTPDVAGQVIEEEHKYAAADTHATKEEQHKIPEEPKAQQDSGDIPAYSDPDTPAEQYHSSAEQFADLHNRLQSMMKHISNVNRDLTASRIQQADRHRDVMSKLDSIQASLKAQEVTANTLRDIQNDVRQTKADLHESLNRHVAGIKTAVRDNHNSVIGTMAKSGHGLGKFFLVVVSSQVVVVGLYYLYKRRKANSPKKYL